MQLTLNIDDRKVSFFLELLQNFDFVSVDKTLSEDELDDLHCEKLYREATREPLETVSWQEVKQQLNGKSAK